MRGTQHALVAHNRKVHDAIAQSYDQIHGEILNATEQARIKSVIAQAVSAVCTPERKRTYLDYGAGTGNLTAHLLAYPAQVIAADISVQSLNEVRRKHQGMTTLHLLQLNGFDLSSIEDSSLDMVATYSVLHHVPDYLDIVCEFCRVLKPGGVISLPPRHTCGEHS